MRIFPLILLIGLVQPALAQNTSPRQDEEIVVTGIADGAKVVEVNFERVWRRCAECKRALKKLDRLAWVYRFEMQTAADMANTGSAGGSKGVAPSTIGSFQRSSANDAPTTFDGLAAARGNDLSATIYREQLTKYVAPERVNMMVHMRSFFDQLQPHVVAAAEQERLAHGAVVGLVGDQRKRFKAARLIRTDVTDAVIRRLDAMPFTIVLPDPPKRTRR